AGVRPPGVAAPGFGGRHTGTDGRCWRGLAVVRYRLTSRRVGGCLPLGCPPFRSTPMGREENLKKQFQVAQARRTQSAADTTKMIGEAKGPLIGDRFGLLLTRGSMVTIAMTLPLEAVVIDVKP